MEKIAPKASLRSGISLSRQDAAAVLMGLFGFFLGRVVLFHFFSPAAVSFLSVFLFGGYRFLLIGLFTALGLTTRLSGFVFVKYLITVSLITAFNIFCPERIRQKGAYIKACACGVSVLAGGLFFAAVYGFSLYFVFLSVLEAVLSMSVFFIFKKGVDILTGHTKRKTLTGEELVGLAVLFGAVTAGASDVYISYVSLNVLMCCVIILFAGFKGGAAMGAASGVTLGFVLMLAGFGNLNMMAVYSISGLVAGLFKKRKPICALAFLASALVIAFYLDKLQVKPELYVSATLAAVLFFFIPDRFYLDIFSVISGSKADYTDKIRELTTERLISSADAFAHLGRSLKKLSGDKAMPAAGDMEAVVGSVAAYACTGCERRRICWDSEFYDSYSRVFSMLEAYEEGRTETNVNLTNCIAPSAFIERAGRVFEIHRTNLNWNKKLAESRELMSDQLVCVSKIIGSLARELNFELVFKDNLEASITEELSINGIGVDGVIVLENKQGKYEVTLNQKACGKRRVCGDIIPIVSGVLGRRMKKEDSHCVLISDKENRCRLKLVEQQRLFVTSGVSHIAKDGGRESGDSFSYMELKNGQCVLVLSDGMGTGSRAREESAAVVELMEDFINSSFDNETAVRMVNSVLVLKSGEESFSTLDICSMDLNTGVAEFIKIGAAASFLIRDGEISVIKSSSLPMGILSTVDLEVSVRKLKDGDIVLMLTDGVLEAFGGINKEQDLMARLGGMRTVNPQDIAASVLDEAKARAGGAKDDMTVLAARIWEKI